MTDISFPAIFHTEPGSDLVGVCIPDLGSCVFGFGLARTFRAAQNCVEEYGREHCSFPLPSSLAEVEELADEGELVLMVGPSESLVI